VGRSALSKRGLDDRPAPFSYHRINSSVTVKRKRLHSSTSTGFSLPLVDEQASALSTASHCFSGPSRLRRLWGATRLAVPADCDRWWSSSAGLEHANLMADLRFFSLLQYLLLVVLNDRHCDLRYGSQAPLVNIDVNLRCLQSQARLITPPLGLVWSPGRVVDASNHL
jgi:hypothetical protein